MLAAVVIGKLNFVWIVFVQFSLCAEIMKQCTASRVYVFAPILIWLI